MTLFAQAPSFLTSIFLSNFCLVLMSFFPWLMFLDAGFFFFFFKQYIGNTAFPFIYRMSHQCSCFKVLSFLPCSPLFAWSNWHLTFWSCSFCQHSLNLMMLSNNAMMKWTVLENLKWNRGSLTLDHNWDPDHVCRAWLLCCEWSVLVCLAGLKQWHLDYFISSIKQSSLLPCQVVGFSPTFSPICEAHSICSFVYLGFGWSTKWASNAVIPIWFRILMCYTYCYKISKKL